MKSAILTALLMFVLVSAPAFAQGNPIDWTLWGSGVDIGSNDLGDGFAMDSEGGAGVGLSANFFVSKHFSIEASVYRLNAEADLAFAGLPQGDDDDDSGFEMGGVDLIPVTLGIQYHFLANSRWDLYLGAGGAWVSASDIESDDLDWLGIGAIEVDDEFSYFGSAGLGFHLTDNFALVLDVRYMSYEPTTTSKATGVSEDLDLSPSMGSLGLRFRF